MAGKHPVRGPRPGGGRTRLDRFLRHANYRYAGLGSRDMADTAIISSAVLEKVGELELLVRGELGSAT